MTDLKQLFKTAVASSMDLRGKPAILGKIDGTLYWSSSRRDMVWARIGENASFQEMVVHCTKVTPQYDMPVRVDLVNGIMSVVAVDEKRYLEFSGNRPGGNVGAHAWLHGRLGPDPLYITGLQYLPLLVVPSNPPGMTVTVKQGAYRWDGVYKILEETISGSLSAYIPGSASVKHFVIICLDRVNNTIVIVDGDDLTGGDDALFGGIVLTTADILAITDGIDISYVPLAAIVLYNGQTEVRAADITMDLRAWGGGAGTSATFTEPPDDAETYGRKTDGTSSWVAVVPKTGGTYTGTVTISQGAASDWAVFNTTDTSTTVHMRWKYNSLDRWAFAKNPEATGGAFALIRYDDAGSAVDSPFTVSRSTGKVVIGSGTAIAGTHAIYGGATFAGNMGFYGTTAIAQPSGVTASTALENLGLGASLTDEIPEPPNDSATYGRRVASGTPGWRLVVPALGGTFTGAVTISAGGLSVSGGLSVVTSGMTVEGGAVFNESGADVDHRFEGDNEPNLFFTDGGNDRIGVGTNAPTQRIDSVYSAAAANYMRIYNSNTGGLAGIYSVSDLGGVIVQAIGSTEGVTGWAGYARVRADAAMNGLFIGAGGAKPVIFAVSDTEHARVHTDGRFGIGTAAPSSKLHVNGSTSLDGAVVINETGASVDTRMESSASQNSFLLSGATGQVMINTTTARGHMTLKRTSSTLDGFAAFEGDNGASNGVVGFTFFEGSTLYGSLQVRLSGVSSPDEFRFITSVANTKFTFYVNSAHKATIQNGLVVGSPTGGDKGNGTINAQAIYDDNVLVSDHLWDLWVDGKMLPEDEEKHPDAKLWSIDEIRNFVTKHRHLPTMPSRKNTPSVGEMVTGLLAMMEIQQIHIMELKERLDSI